MYCNLHVHSSYSNASVGFPDSINSVKQIVERAQELNYCGVALTDHEIMAGHVEMYKLQKDYPNLKLILGNEIYCMTEEQFITKRDASSDVPYYHLILIALDIVGWRQLCKLSSFAWENSFVKRGSTRRITTKEYIKEVVGQNPGHVVCCSACMGGEISKLLMAEKTHDAEQVVKEFQSIFGKENYYLEIQPNNKNTHQWESNRRVIRLAKKLKVPLIATTDAHMLDKTEKIAHAAAKNSKFSEDAEGEDFYATAYLMSEDELRVYLRNNLSDNDIDTVLQNTIDISNRVSNYDGILHAQMVPEIPVQYIPEFKIKHTFKKYYDKYQYFNLYAHKEDVHEAYAFYEIEDGLINKVLNTNLAPRIEDYIARINNEMDIMNAIDEHNGSKLIAYYSTCKFMCDEIWKLGSPVGIGRGSAGCWEINWVLDISQINPLEMGDKQELLFSERHMNKLRLDVMADVDTDSSPMYRQKIINRFKEIWGTDRLLQVATYGTLKPKAAIKRACKGLNIEDEVADAMAMLVPVERGEARPLSICLDSANPGKVSELITEVSKYEGLKEILLRLEGVIVSMGSHAGGVVPCVPVYTDMMAAVKSPSGAMQTCFNLDDAEAVGATKYDILTTSAMELIRKCCELLIRDGYIEQKNSFREAYESVIGVDNLVYEDPDLWNKITRCPQCFQFETAIGKQILSKINPKSVEELTIASSLMRLLPAGVSELPADRYLRYRDNPRAFRNDCLKAGLTKDEIDVLEEVCKVDGYMTIHQETLMKLSMHPKTAAYTYKEANALRKSVAKKSKSAQDEAKKTFYEWCEKNGTREEFAHYIWTQMFSMQLGYGFSYSHSYAYALIALQELNLFHRFPEEYWYASILDTEGISSEESSGAGVNYGKISKAIYGLKEAGINVDPPLINMADSEFGVDVDNHRILFALSAIPLINDDDVQIIKEQREQRLYENLEDFVTRSQFTKSKIVNLIKAGCFGEPKKRIKYYAKLLAADQMPSKFGMTQAKKYPGALLDLAMQNNMALILSLKSEDNFVGTKGSKKVYRLAEEYYRLCDDLKYDQDWWQDGDEYCITDKGIDKALKKDEIKNFVKTDEFKDKFKQYLAKDILSDLIKGSIDVKQWQFQTTNYYHDENIFVSDMMKNNNWKGFDEMPEEPIYTNRINRYNRTWREYELYSMPVTVVDKNDIRHTIFGLTADNKVVQIKMQDGEYVYYKSKIQNDGNWFERGNLLILHGYRNGDEFRLKKYMNGVYEHTIYKINKLLSNKIKISCSKS